MIAVPAGMRVLVATRPIDFRKGADGLVALVSETLGNDPFSGTVFVEHHRAVWGECPGGPEAASDHNPGRLHASDPRHSAICRPSHKVIDGDQKGNLR
jgi:hypothetical protein